MRFLSFIHFFPFHSKPKAVCWLSAYLHPRLKKLKLSSCVQSEDMLVVTARDERIYSQVDFCEENGYISNIILGLEIVVVVVGFFVGVIFGGFLFIGALCIDLAAA